MPWKLPSKTKEPDNEQKAYEYAVFLLSLKLRTVGEMIKKMQMRGFSELVIEQIIEQLKAQKYLNDQQYAEIFLENLKAYRNIGYYGIKKKFMEKKVPPALIESLLGEYFSIDEEEKIARRFLKREGFAVKTKSEDQAVQYRMYGDQEQNKEKNKIANRLKSRGFRGEVISKLVFG